MIPITINGQPSYAENGALLSEVISIAMPCAGKGKCGKCRVVAKGALSSLSDEEKKHLTAEKIAGGVRFACCTRVLGEAEITTIQEGSSKIKTDGIMPSFARKPLFKRLGAAIDIGTTTLAAQLAKSAVCAGLQTILSMKGIQPPQVKNFVIAGGFGSYLDVESAAKIGLIPPQLAPKAHIAGNAALSGAAMLLLNSNFIKKSEALAKSAVTLELSSSAEFMELYVENMMFED
ncbi:MAG: DUF4445 domain-containing protein [Clostridia bacterium]|nr:DUF4445 domain-containing protein [Clostridia bacterium]NLS85554.1 DUF4445 domain-containing protein [Oscillospiraceae bacterium]